MPNFSYSYKENGKLVRGNGSLIPICSVSNRSLLPCLTVLVNFVLFIFWKKVKTPKRHFEITWPLDFSKDIGSIHFLLYHCVKCMPISLAFRVPYTLSGWTTGIFQFWRWIRNVRWTLHHINLCPRKHGLCKFSQPH